MTYKEDFLSALNITSELNLFDSNYYIDQSNIFGSSTNYIEIRKVLTHIFPEFETHGLARLCVGVSCFMKPFLEKLLGTKLYVTSGYFVEQGTKRFHLDQESALKSINRTEKSDKIDFHTWLTLPSLEILDLTIGSSLALIYKDVPKNEFLFMNPDNLNEMSYHPVIVGENFLEKSKLWSKEIFEEIAGFQY